MDKIGKVFVVEAGCRRCLVCNVLFTWQAGRVHSTETCIPAPSDLVSMPTCYAAVEGQA